MTVRYVRVRPISDLFAPATVSYGNVAVVGKVTPPAKPPDDMAKVGEATVFTDPGEARRRAPGELATSIERAFQQSPGPTVVIGVRVDEKAPDYGAAFATLAAENVQIVVVANTPMNADNIKKDAPIDRLRAHVVEMSGDSGGDGKERIGVAMLDKGIADPSVVAGDFTVDEMVYVAHKSDQDAAAAVAGTIAGVQPHISLLLKPVAITSPSFTPAEILQLNGPETFETGPAGNGVNWLGHPSLLPGQGVYLGEGYTGKPDGKKYIDRQRTIAWISNQLKVQLIRAIGNLRISRPGLRTLIAQMESVLEPLVAAEVIDSYQVVVPLLAALDKEPVDRTAGEEGAIKTARAERRIEVLALVDYAAAIHRLSITLKFD